MTDTSPDVTMFLQEDGPRVVLVSVPEPEVDDLARRIASAGMATVRIVRGRRCTTKQLLFREWAAALQFPSYFGENWDAFEDCLLDRDWLEGNLHVIAITSVETLLTGKRRDSGTLWEILLRAVQTDESPRLRLILQSARQNETKVRKALAQWHIRV